MIVGVCGILTCYLRLVGYLAVSFKCPYRASVDPACSCLFQMNTQVHNRYFRVTNTRDYILMSIRYFPVVTDYFEYRRRVAHWHSWWIDYNNSASQPPVLCLRRTRPAWCEAEIKHVQQRAGENNLKLNTSKSKQMIFLQRHAWALSVSIGTLCLASSSTTNLLPSTTSTTYFHLVPAYCTHWESCAVTEHHKRLYNTTSVQVLFSRMLDNVVYTL